MSRYTPRTETRPVKVGNLTIGHNNQVIMQSMCTTKTTDVAATVAQIRKLEDAGCQLVRVAVPDEAAANALADIKKQIQIPLVADIHFDYRLALIAMDNHVDKIRINPGNIGRKDRVEKVVIKAKEKKVPIRIGVNSGSLEKKHLDKYGSPTAAAMVASALDHIQILEELDFHDIIVSLKAANTSLAIEAYCQAASTFAYPLHLGITEAGTKFSGSIKSAAGLGAILARGIGNTARVSLSADPVEEIKVLKEILKSFDLIDDAATLISCPTCGRIQIDLIPIANEMDAFIESLQVPIKVAIMGCGVNGPGEAREADIGIAGGKGKGMLFKKGKIVRTVPEADMVAELKREILAMADMYTRTGSFYPEPNN